MFSKLADLWAKEPVAVLGILGTIVVFALEQFAGHGIISADTVDSVVKLGAALAPFVIALLGRSQVSSPATVAALQAVLTPIVPDPVTPPDTTPTGNATDSHETTDSSNLAAAPTEAPATDLTDNVAGGDDPTNVDPTAGG